MRWDTAQAFPRTMVCDSMRPARISRHGPRSASDRFLACGGTSADHCERSSGFSSSRISPTRFGTKAKFRTLSKVTEVPYRPSDDRPFTPQLVSRSRIAILNTQDALHQSIDLWVAARRPIVFVLLWGV
jgi:hypothetical protein